MSNTAVAFDGTLHVENKTDNGKINFVVNGTNIPLQMRAGYELTKAAGVPYFSTDASSYLVDYTVTLTLDQDVQLSGSAELPTRLRTAKVRSRLLRLKGRCCLPALTSCAYLRISRAP